MSDSTTLLITVIIVGVIFLVIHQIDRRSRRDGGMFIRSPSVTMRIFAGLLGLVFGVVFIYEMVSSDFIHFIWPVVSLALIAYSIGAGDLLLELQGGKALTHSPAGIVTHDSEPSAARRLIRLLLVLITGLAGVVAVFCGSLWIIGHPEAGTPFVIALAIGFIALIPLRYLSFLFELYRIVKKQGSGKREL